MIEKNDLEKIKKIIEEFFEKMTIEISNIEINFKDFKEENKDLVEINIKTNEPQILIGQQGQTLFELQRLLKIILNKKTQKIFYFNLDINEYKKKKVEYLKNLAKDLADQASLNKEEKVLLPMSAYERRIIHSELSQRQDITTESQGNSFIIHKDQWWYCRFYLKDNQYHLCKSYFP